MTMEKRLGCSRVVLDIFLNKVDSDLRDPIVAAHDRGDEIEVIRLMADADAEMAERQRGRDFLRGMN